MIHNDIKNYIVTVCNGSGVLVQPMSEDYTYILTASHCIQIDIDDYTKGYLSNNDIIIHLNNGDKIDVIDVYTDGKSDIAIILVSNKILSSVEIFKGDINSEKKYHLCGYPDDRRGLQPYEDKYSQQRFEYLRNKDETILIFNPNARLMYPNIIGFSGGGVFIEMDNSVYLCAIENKIHGNKDREYHAQIEATILSKYDDLISRSAYQGNNLALLFPVHFSNFNNLIEFIFNFDKNWNDDKKLETVKSVLQEVGKKDIINVNIKPFDIFNDCKDYFKINNRSENDILNRWFWAHFFELLIISVLIDTPAVIDLVYIKDFLRKRRYLFIPENSTWKEFSIDILTTKYKDLNENGFLITKTYKPTTGQAYFTSEELKDLIETRDISNVCTDENLIDNAIGNIDNNCQLVDLTSLHQLCIESKEKEFKECNGLRARKDILQKATHLYSSFLLNGQ